jgi:hypothetical protein
VRDEQDDHITAQNVLHVSACFSFSSDVSSLRDVEIQGAGFRLHPDYGPNQGRTKGGGGEGLIMNQAQYMRPTVPLEPSILRHFHSQAERILAQSIMFGARRCNEVKVFDGPLLVECSSVSI